MYFATENEVYWINCWKSMKNYEVAIHEEYRNFVTYWPNGDDAVGKETHCVSIEQRMLYLYTSSIIIIILFIWTCWRINNLRNSRSYNGSLHKINGYPTSESLLYRTLIKIFLFCRNKWNTYRNEISLYFLYYILYYHNLKNKTQIFLSSNILLQVYFKVDYFLKVVLL